MLEMHQGYQWVSITIPKVLVHPVISLYYISIIARPGQVEHGRGKPGHYYTTDLRNRRKYSSGDPCGRHVSLPSAMLEQLFLNIS